MDKKRKISALLLLASMVVPYGVTYAGATSGLTEVVDVQGSIDYKGADVTFTLNGTDLVQDDIKAYVILKEDEMKKDKKRCTEIEKSIKFLDETTKNTSKKKLTLHFPENKYNKSVEYIVRFSVDGAEKMIYRDFQKTVKVRKNPNGVEKKEENVAPTEENVTKFTSTNVDNKYNFTISGKNLDTKDIKVKIKEKMKIGNKESFIENSELTSKVKLTKNLDDIKFSLDFPNEEKEYKVCLMYKNKELKDKSIDVKIKNKEDAKISSIISVDSKKEGLKYTFTIKGENLDVNKINYKKVLLDKENQGELVDKIKFEKVSDSEIKATLVFPENKTDKDLKYTVEFGLNQSDKKSVDCVISKNDKVKKEDEENLNPQVSISKISKVTLNGVSKEKENYTASFKIDGENLNKGDLKVKVTEGIKRRDDIEKTLNQSLTSQNISMPSLKFNKEDNEKTFKVYFNVDGTDNFLEKNSVDVKIQFENKLDPDPTVDPKEDENKKGEMEIREFKAVNPKLSKDGGVAKVTVKGENLDSKKLNAEIFKIVDGKEEKVDKKIEFNGTDKIQTATINFEKAEKEETYIVKLLDKSTKIVVGGRESLETTAVVPEMCYINNDGNEIVVKFYAKIEKVVNDKEFKNGITIDDKALTDEDEVILNKDKIIIKLKNSIKLKKGSNVNFKERLFKGVLDNKENQTFKAFIKGAVPFGNYFEFTKGQVLPKEGGECKLLFKGENLKENVKVKVLKSDKKRTLIGTTEDNFVKINKKSDNEQEISFTLPENKSKISESYTILVSVDGGRKYSSDYGANVLKSEKEKTTVATVLASDKVDDKPTLSFMSITSYGTQGGGTNEPDITHTDTPVGQGSKKTWISLYGANLKESLTKVKIIDQNGVQWYPLENEGTTDSMDNFLLVIKNNAGGFGIFGEGTSQKIELICPRNIRIPNGNPTSPTYKVLVAVDGVNYNTEITTTITVTDDGDPVKESLTEDKIKEVNVEYETLKGEKVLESKKVKGYTWSKLRSFNIRAVEKEGYKLKGLKVNKEDKLLPLSYLNETEIYDSVNKKIIENVKFIYEKIDKDDNKKDDSTTSKTENSGNTTKTESKKKDDSNKTNTESNKKDNFNKGKNEIDTQNKENKQNKDKLTNSDLNKEENKNTKNKEPKKQNLPKTNISSISLSLISALGVSILGVFESLKRRK